MVSGVTVRICSTAYVPHLFSVEQMILFLNRFWNITDKGAKSLYTKFYVIWNKKSRTSTVYFRFKNSLNTLTTGRAHDSFDLQQS